MISTVTLSFDLTASPPVGVVTDSTNYSGVGGLGIDLNLTQAKGLGIITFNGDEIVNKTDPNNPAQVMIDLQSLGGNPQVFEFPLVLDLNGNVANGVYTLQYSLRLNTTATPFTIDATPTANTIVIDTTNSWLADFLQSGNEVTLSLGAATQDVLVASAEFLDPNVTITTSTIIDSATYDQLTFDLTNVQLDAVYSYSGCTQTTADVSFTYDCEVGDSGAWAVANTTFLKSNEIVYALNCAINYPSWTTVTPVFPGNVVVDSLPYPSLNTQLNPLATGTYSVSMSQVIQQTQTDGLILQYTTSVIKEFHVSCSGSLCGLTPCIESLRVAHQAELQRNRISKYQVFVDNVLLYYAEAQNYRACGDTDNYRATLELIKQNLDASGRECACCDDNVYYWVSNNSGDSVIDSLIESFQFRLFNLTPPGPGSPLSTDDSTKGVQIGALWQNVNTGIIYRCTNNAIDGATWAVYYTPGGAITAADVTANAQPNFLNALTVQLQLAQADNELQNLSDAIANLPDTLNATNITYNATINGSTVTTVQQALEFLRISLSDYSNSLLYYDAGDNVSTTLDRISTAKVAIRVSDSGIVQVIGNNAYDPTSAAPTMVLQLDSSYRINFPIQWIDPTYTAVQVTSTIKDNAIDDIKAEAGGTAYVTVAFYINGTRTTTISPFQMTIERFR